jgi:phosphatidylglycerol:prolipoprotein diacylglycerol transferase
MSENNTRFRRPNIEPYWYVIALFTVGAAFIFLRHLITHKTPSRVAIHLGFLNFDIYWYGILIVGGIALGTWVTARLAMERGVRAMRAKVPADVRDRPLSELALPDELANTFEKSSITTLGQLLLEWGLGPDRLALNKSGRQQVQQLLEETPGVEHSWIEDAPWRQWNPDFAWSGVAWALVLGVIGARLYHVLTPSPSMAEVGINSALDYFRHPMQLINIRSGGLGIYGAIVGGGLGLLIYTRRQRVPALAWADLAAVGLALGQFIGRWGNFFNQELYGKPSNLPWAIHIDMIYRLDDYVNFETFHPAFLYESLWNLMAFLVLLTLARRRWRQLQVGDLTALYLVLYAVGRILLELVRLDSRTVSLAGIDLGLPVATLVSIIVALPMASLLIWRHVLHRAG